MMHKLESLPRSGVLMVNLRRDALSWKGLTRGSAAWQSSGLPTWMSMKCFKQSCNSSLQHTWSASGDDDLYVCHGERSPFAESWKDVCVVSFCHTLCCLLPEAESEASSFRADVCMCWKPCMLLISLQSDLCNHYGRNLEYLEGQLEGHRLLQRNKMEIADRQVVLSYASFFLPYFGHKQTFDVNPFA